MKTYKSWDDITQSTLVSNDDTILLSGSKIVTFETFKNTHNFVNVVRVMPSNDTTGVTDVTNINAAIIEAAPVGNSIGVVILQGQYYVNSVLKIGSHSDITVSAPSLVGDGHARINYVGSQTDDYLITIAGYSNEPRDVLANLELYCGNNCRGVLASGVWYMSVLRNLFIRNFREVGLDALDCWGGKIENIEIYTGTGYGLRCYRCNSTVINLVRIAAISGIQHVNSSDQEALINYAMVNGGNSAASTYYGADYTEAWPNETTDTYAKKADGTTYRSQTYMRSAACFDACTDVHVNNLMFEGCDHVDYPLLFVQGANGSFVNTYMEANKTTLNKVILRGYDQPGDTVFNYGVANIINGIYCNDGTETGGILDAETACENCVELLNYSLNQTIKNIYARGLTQSIVQHNNGQHTNSTIENNHAFLDTVRNIRLLNSATINSSTISVASFGAVGDGVTDDTNAIQDAISSLSSSGTLFFPPGTYICTSELVLPANTKLIGHGVTLDFSSQTSFTNAANISFKGTTTSLGTEGGTYSIGNRTWTITGHGLDSDYIGRVLNVINDTSGSYNAVRTSYKKQEMFVIARIVDANTIETAGSSKLSWDVAEPMEWSLLEDSHPEISGSIKIIGGGSSAVSQHKCVLFENVSFFKAEGVYTSNTTYAGIDIRNSYGGIISKCHCMKELVEAGNEYGIVISNSHTIRVSDSVLYGYRHGSAVGGEGMCVDIHFTDCTIESSEEQAAADFHGNVIHSSYYNCTIDPEISIGGNHNTIEGCNIVAGQSAYGINFSETKGTSFRLLNNNITNVNNGAYAVFFNAGTSDCDDGGIFVIDGLDVRPAASSSIAGYIWITNNVGSGPTGNIEYSISNVRCDSNTTESAYAIKIDHSAADAIKHISINNVALTGGVWIINANSVVANNVVLHKGTARAFRISGSSGIFNIDNVIIDGTRTGLYLLQISADATSRCKISNVDIRGSSASYEIINASDLEWLNIDNITYETEPSLRFLDIAATVAELRVSNFYISDLSKNSILSTKNYLNISGVSMPNSLVSSVGSIYTRTDGDMGSTIYIKESGDSATGWMGKSETEHVRYPISTGGDDTAMLQAVIDELTLTTAQQYNPTIVLNGEYKISSPLITGGGSRTTARPVRITSDGYARLNYTGAKTDDYMIRYYGEGRNSGDWISNIQLDCNYNCRGIYADHKTYHLRFADIGIRSSRQVGIDLYQSWGIHITGIVFHSSCRGINIRCPSLNGGVIEHIKFAGSGYYDNNGIGSTEDVNRYIVANWGSWVTTGPSGTWDIQSDWPPTSSDSYSDNLTAADERGVLCIKGSGGRISSCHFEGCHYADVPLAYIEGGNINFQDLYLENNENYETKFSVLRPHGSSYGIGPVTFKNITMADGDWGDIAGTSTKYFLTTEGITGGCRVENLWGNIITDAVLYQKVGTHYGNTVGNVTLRVVETAVHKDSASDAADYATVPLFDLISNPDSGVTDIPYARVLDSSLYHNFDFPHISLIANQDFTIEVWAKMTNATGGGFLINNTAYWDSVTNSGFSVRTYSDNTLRAYLVDDANAGSVRKELISTYAVFGTASYTHIIVRYDRSGNMTCYINGVLDAATVDISAFNGVITPINTRTLIGAGNRSSSNFAGYIGPVRVFDGVLSSADCVSLWNSGSPVYYASLSSALKTAAIAAWDMSGDSTAAEIDQAGTRDAVTYASSVTPTNIPQQS